MSKTQKPRIQVLMKDEKEVSIAHRNAAIYAASVGLITTSTTEAVRHMLLNLDPIALLSRPKIASDAQRKTRRLEVDLPEDIYRVVAGNHAEIISASVRESYAMQGADL